MANRKKINCYHIEFEQNNAILHCLMIIIWLVRGALSLRLLKADNILLTIERILKKAMDRFVAA